mmetsp:Transcript_62240/g.166761  ORF Transcript_62240/g.166761 Transcript_62240/m.166761 type:complete len:246 (-) Transcript_62240:382-1119(-)
MAGPQSGEAASWTASFADFLGPLARVGVRVSDVVANLLQEVMVLRRARLAIECMGEDVAVPGGHEMVQQHVDGRTAHVVQLLLHGFRAPDHPRGQQVGEHGTDVLLLDFHTHHQLPSRVQGYLEACDASSLDGSKSVRLEVREPTEFFFLAHVSLAATFAFFPLLRDDHGKMSPAEIEGRRAHNEQTLRQLLRNRAFRLEAISTRGQLHPHRVGRTPASPVFPEIEAQLDAWRQAGSRGIEVGIR